MSAPISLSKTDLAKSVVEQTGVCAGVLPADEVIFWRELAAYFALTIKTKDTGRLAKAVLTELEAEWDDDFVEEEGGLSLALYETLEEGVRRHIQAKSLGVGDEIDEDDEQGLQRELNIKPLTWALSTVFDQIRDRTLVLNPEWQRSFVWKAKKQKRLIESILLGLPLPSFLIFTDSDSGKKYVIDGRQRLETIAKFKAPREARGEQRTRFKTFSSREPGWRPGEFLAEAAGKYYDQLPQRFKTRIDGTGLVVAEFVDILPGDLYQVFKRYNTGAVALNAAEIRNAVYQASPLHKMLFRLAGEQGADAAYVDAEEERVSVDLRETMQGKRQRYGAYDFIGRYFAFAHQSTGTVATATVAYMDRFQHATAEVIEEHRLDFISAFNSAREWYPDFLVDPEERRFHAFLATVQLVSTRLMMKHVTAHRVTREDAAAAILREWPAFVRNRLARKQNSTLFWNSQKTWVSLLEEGLRVAAGDRHYAGHDWQHDLEPEAPAASQEA